MNVAQQWRCKHQNSEDVAKQWRKFGGLRTIVGYNSPKGTLSFLCYSSIPATAHVNDISIPDSFMYLAKDMYLTFPGMITWHSW